MAFKSSFVAVAVLGIAVAGGSAWWLQSRPQGPTPVNTSGSGGAGDAAGKPAAGASGAARVAGVEVAKVEAVSLRDDVQAVGSLRARQSVMLRPELVGRITALNFKDGGPVRKGQILVQFDDQLQQAELQQMQAQLAIAQASFKRTQELVAQNFMAQQTLDTSAANLKVAQAQLALAQARLNRMAVRAPFDGTAGIRLVNVGDYVKDGADLVALEDTRQMLVDYRVPERAGGKLKPGQTVELVLDALPGRAFSAVVEAVEPLMDASGRSVAVRAVVSGAGKPKDKSVGKPTPQAANQTPVAGDKKSAKPVADGSMLRSGMFARVTTVFSVNEAALVVPEEAIVPQGNRQLVYKLVPPETGVKLPPEVKFVSMRQEVKLGVRRQGKVEILDGVALGDTVVVAGQQRLQKDGAPVRIVELGRPAGKASGPQNPASTGAAAVAAAPASAASR
jgi:membrane fusion protein (multidrug efflux system)